MSYQEQLAYLRQKYNLETEQANTDTTPAWEEVDEQTEKKLKEREERDRWIADAGMSPIAEMPDPYASEAGKQMVQEFDDIFTNNPMVQKYGPRLLEAVKQMRTEVDNPNTPFDMNQAQSMLRQMIAEMRMEARNGSK